MNLVILKWIEKRILIVHRFLVKEITMIFPSSFTIAKFSGYDLNEHA